MKKRVKMLVALVVAILIIGLVKKIYDTENGCVYFMSNDGSIQK